MWSCRSKDKSRGKDAESITSFNNREVMGSLIESSLS